MKNNPKWPNRPKSLSERGYRKYMSKTKKVTIGEQEFTLQSVSPKWYFDFNDECGMNGGKRALTKYIDGLIKNCVVSPPELKSVGLDYFEEKEDIRTPEKLVKEIEQFLRE